MDIRSIIHHLRSGLSERQVSRDLGIHRHTVRRYHSWARAHGLMRGELPPLEDLQRLASLTLSEPCVPQNTSSVEPYRAVVEQLVRQNVEVAAIHQRLMERGYQGAYSSVYRFVQQIRPRLPDATVRVERAPGYEAQVDFGYAGLLIDPVTDKKRRSWAFVMTLSYSRHQYVEFVFDQKVATWLLCHRHSFEFFSGVPSRVVIDNLKTAITRAVADDPQVQQGYRECAEHYGFLIAPCRKGTPEHKGKVEQGGVHYVKRNFLSGREPMTITQANALVRTWCMTTAGHRIHGTVKEQPLMRFEQVEKARLLPLPSSPYEQALWKRAKLHRDCYVVFESAYYSAPCRLIGKTLVVSGGLNMVRIFTPDYALVATHDKAQKPGERMTNPDHLPPHKLSQLALTRHTALGQAAKVGVHMRQVIETWLADKVIDRLATCGRLLKLRDRYSHEQLEAACSRALCYGDPGYTTIKRILRYGLEDKPLPPVATAAPATVFVRSAEELVGHLQGGVSWK